MIKSCSLSQFGGVAAMAMAMLASMAFATTPAQARERQATVGGTQGNSATRNVQRTGGDVSSTTTGSGGKSTSRSVDRSAEGTQATVTGPKGESVTRNVTRKP